MRSVVVVLVLAACAGKESKPDTSAPPTPTPTADAQVAAPKPIDPKPPAPAVTEAKPPDGFDFTPTGQRLFSVVACGGAAKEGSHCKEVHKTQEDYKTGWLDAAKKFFAEKVPSDIPKKVVYPFAGGDLSTALTVFPDADEITTLSLEPAGDPRTLEALNAGKGKGALAKALRTVHFELDFLYRVNFSNTMNMIDAMRGGALPTQLVFGLSALDVHGFELVWLRYFKLDDAGAINYLSDDDVKNAPAIAVGNASARNRVFANAELGFRKPGSAGKPSRVQIYRHLQVNLDDPHLAKDNRALLHLKAKGPVSGMTKAASYLLSWDSFKLIRAYMIENVVWMVSDATGIAPKWGKPAGFEYETYGSFWGPHIGAGNQIWKNWNAEFVAQPKREMPFRFGYYDKKGANHFVIMRKKKT